MTHTFNNMIVITGFFCDEALLESKQEIQAISNRSDVFAVYAKAVTFAYVTKIKSADHFSFLFKSFSGFPLHFSKKIVVVLFLMIASGISSIS